MCFSLHMCLKQTRFSHGGPSHNTLFIYLFIFELVLFFQVLVSCKLRTSCQTIFDLWMIYGSLRCSQSHGEKINSMTIFSMVFTKCPNSIRQNVTKKQRRRSICVFTPSLITPHKVRLSYTYQKYVQVGHIAIFG